MKIKKNNYNYKQKKIMKTLKIYRILVAIALVLAVNSCNSSDVLPAEGPISENKFDKTELDFLGEESSEIIKSDKGAWGIGIVEIFEENEEKRYDNDFYMKEWGDGNISQQLIKNFSAEWISLTQSESDLQLEVKVSENNTGKDRTAIVTLLGRVLYKNVTITINQKSK